LGGYEQILKRMTSSNFNWFLHTMLFYPLEQEKSGPQVDGVTFVSSQLSQA
ncbi:hypothetical protein F5887DRAFT_894296, partial [Amanita rubescens]